MPGGSPACGPEGPPYRVILKLMTKVQIRFRLPKALDETQLQRLGDANAVYGIQGIKLSPAMDGLTVEYDATRLRPAEVESTLAGAGIPVEPA
jgi:hypothetical protein